jgi:apolipoprotein N-acyltransferase
MHAAENGIDLVQAAITGKSAIITDGGEIAEITELYEEAVISGTVRFRSSGRTLSGLWGNWVSVVAVAALVASLGWTRLSRNRE